MKKRGESSGWRQDKPLSVVAFLAIEGTKTKFNGVV